MSDGRHEGAADARVSALWNRAVRRSGGHGKGRRLGRQNERNGLASKTKSKRSNTQAAEVEEGTRGEVEGGRTRVGDRKK